MAYNSKNGFTHVPSLPSIVTLLLYIAQVTLHSICIVPGTRSIDHPILWVLLGTHYAALLFVMHDTVWIMAHDPVDRVVLDPELIDRYEYYELDDCTVCGRRLKGSHHCAAC